MRMPALLRGQRLLAPEVVQTSSMDCGPAALKCLLEGFHIPVSYGRLREACQTDVDGTSIDTLEVVAGQLGLQAKQVLVPADHAWPAGPGTLPAIAVVSQADTSTHFVVVWRRVGAWLQLMDPGKGRRWMRESDFRGTLYRHTMSVDASDWRAWAASEEFLQPLQARMAALGVAAGAALPLVQQALQAPGWFHLGALDACVRLVQSVADAGGLSSRADAEPLLRSLFDHTVGSAQDIYGLVPEAYWSVTPDGSNTDTQLERLRLHGAVLLRVAAAGAQPAAGQGSQAEATTVAAAPELSPELQAALSERAEPVLSTVWRLLRADGLLAPLALASASVLATGVLMFETLLFRGLFDLAEQLTLPSQRLMAGLALVVFVGLLLALQIPIAQETMRQGRQLEIRLRMALLRKLPRLNDRYFQSRPISDMADRSHGIQHVRGAPELGMRFVQTVGELCLTLLGIVIIAPGSAAAAVLLTAFAFAVPMLAQPLLSERDLRVRNHSGALSGFYLDALLGLTAVRAHRAEQNVRRQHEGLLVEWAASLRGLIRGGLAADSVQALLCTCMAGYLLLSHFHRAQGVDGSDLLLVFWVLKLPAIGTSLAHLAHSYPAQRNALLRLLEPLSAPEVAEPAAAGAAGAGEAPATAARAQAAAPTARAPLPGVALQLHAGTVLAAGHAILHEVDLQIGAGEHVAVVGASGAGKSSLLGLLLGWHRLSSGTLLVDGVPLDARQLERLREVTAWVDPGVQIWNQSFIDNLAYASPDSGMVRISEVIHAARLRGLLEKLPEGLQTLLGEGGSLLSGGEGQRVRLGRALLMPNPRLVLLDEPFRGLDRQQRHELLGQARGWWRGQTLLCVTHDVGETLQFDRVLVVAEGRIVDDGPPGQLASRAGPYQDLLQAEERLRRQLWRGPQWRRLQVHDGQLTESRGLA